MSTDQTIDFPYHQILDEDLPPKSKSGVSDWVYYLLMAIFYGLVLLLAYFFIVGLSYDPWAKKLSLNENLALYIRNSYSIYAGSLAEGTLSTAILLALNDERRVSREPIDLACVIEFPGARDAFYAEVIENALKETLPFLTEQDRLSTVVFDEGFPDRPSLAEPMFNFVPLTHTTKENKETIFSNIGEEFSAKGSGVIYPGLQTAIKFLNQRKSTNAVTGIMLYTRECNRDQISEILSGLKSPNGGSIHYAFVLCSEPQRGSYPPYIPFKNNLEEIQASVFGNVEFFAKPVQSELFQGVEILKAEFKEYHEEIPHRMFIGKNVSLFPIRQRDFHIDIKIPNPTLPVPEETTNVKIANFEMVFTSVSGQRVIKNEDFAIEIWS